MTTQLELPFDVDTTELLAAIPDGAIVAQTWPWIGKYQEIYPYWQVRSSYSNQQMIEDRIRREHRSWSGSKVLKEVARVNQDHRLMYEMNKKPVPPPQRHYFCEAIPFGMHPREVHWFESSDIFDTGLRWTVPSHEDLESWCKGAPSSKDEFARNTYVRWINGKGTGCPDPKKCARLSSKGEWCHHWPPYEQEIKLLELLGTLPPAFPRWTQLMSRGEYECLAPKLIDLLEKRRSRIDG